MNDTAARAAALQTVLTAAEDAAHRRELALNTAHDAIDPHVAEIRAAIATLDQDDSTGPSTIARDRVFSAFGRLLPDLEDYLDEHGKLPPPEAYAAMCKAAVVESVASPLPLIGRERAIADSLMSDLLKRCFGLIEGPYETARGAYALVQTRAPDSELTGHTFRVETSLNLAIARP
jgi:hypothetical protein